MPTPPVSRLTRLDPICDHPRLRGAAGLPTNSRTPMPRSRIWSSRAAARASSERCGSKTPSAAAVVDLWGSRSLGPSRGGRDGRRGDRAEVAGARRRRAVHRGGDEAAGRGSTGAFPRCDWRRAKGRKLGSRSRGARTVIGVAGLVTFLTGHLLRWTMECVTKLVTTLGFFSYPT